MSWLPSASECGRKVHQEWCRVGERWKRRKVCREVLVFLLRIKELR